MPYKIYTYEDPYKIDEASFWEEIKAFPHFCVARTLVNGLKDVMQDSITGLICPFENLVSHELVYREWTKNISLRIQQYSILSSIFRNLLEKGQIDDSFYLSLVQNQNHFLDALRLFIELGISADSLNSSKANKEQRVFIYCLSKLNDLPAFCFPETPSCEKLHDIISDLAVKELDEYREKHRNNITKKDQDWYTNAIKETKKQALTAIVVHGIHQFEPPQLRLLTEMEEMGITIIFLFNYQKKYSEIYSSWKDIYSQFGEDFIHDDNIKGYYPDLMQTPGNALACAMGTICQNTTSINDPKFASWYSLYKNIPFHEFTNITEYAHYASTHLDKAIKAYKENQSVIERGNHVWNNAAVLKFLDEQIYSANKDVQTLLKIYYPQFSKNRHFLAYPIGQFFSSLYKLWDYKTNSICIDVDLIKECLSSNILQSGKGEVLLRTLNTIEITFQGINSFSEFQQHIEGEYLTHYSLISTSKSTDYVYPLRQLSIYNKYAVSKADINNLISAIKEINNIAVSLFSNKSSPEGYIEFGKHFEKLELFLQQREFSLATAEERILINALQLRLDEIKPERSKIQGTFHDLQQGLYFYLKQKEEENENADWIVKNFEQIDGDILQSKKQVQNNRLKAYHFACVSDRDMNYQIDDLLPWPLTDSFIRYAYSPIDLQFRVYYTALSQRSDFLRYALFYGLYYNCSNSVLSYVKQYESETTEPYSLIKILGLKAKNSIIDNPDSYNDPPAFVRAENARKVNYTVMELSDMFLCPYRFFLDYVMQNSPVYSNDFLYQKFYENFLLRTVWKRIEKLTQTKAIEYLDNCISQENAKIRRYFFFWKNSEIVDLERRAKNYLINNIINDKENKVMSPYSDIHVALRTLFGKAKFDIDITESELRHPYKSFEALTYYPKPSVKSYSLHKIPINDRKAQNKALLLRLKGEAQDYLNQKTNSSNSAMSSDWCTFCTHRGKCIEPYLKNN